MIPKKVLIVDDNIDFLNTIGPILEDEGHQVYLINNNKQALQFALSNQVDVALVDLRLQGDDEEDESGLVLALALRNVNATVRIVIVTGYSVKTASIRRAIQYYRITEYLEKTSEIDLSILDLLKQEIHEDQRTDTFLTFSMAMGQTLTVRARGEYVLSSRTTRVLTIETRRFAHQVEIARSGNANHLRFQIKTIGQELWQEIFQKHASVLDIYSRAEERSDRLSFQFEAPNSFLQLPLEFLTNDSKILALEYPIVRFIYGSAPRRNAISPNFLATVQQVTKKLRILLIASNTKPDIPGVDEEIKELLMIFKTYDFIDVKFINTERASFARVERELSGSNYDIVHYAGHGFFDWTDPESSFLVFWKEINRGGGTVQMSSNRLHDLLKESAVRFFFLSCCSGTASGSEDDLLYDDFLGIAEAINRSGVPTVLGYRWPVSDMRAIDLAVHFYRSLLKHGRPDIALWEARKKLYASNPDDMTYFSPIMIHQV